MQRACRARHEICGRRHSGDGRCSRGQPGLRGLGERWVEVRLSSGRLAYFDGTVKVERIEEHTKSGSASPAPTIGPKPATPSTPASASLSPKPASGNSPAAPKSEVESWITAILMAVGTVAGFIYSSSEATRVAGTTYTSLPVVEPWSLGHGLLFAFWGLIAGSLIATLIKWMRKIS